MAMILWNRSINDNIKWHNRVKYFPKNPGTGEYRILEITQRIHDGADCYPWRKTFALWPRRSISGQWIWMSVVYKRRFWVMWGTGFHMEPEVEYATILEILADKRET